MDLNNLAGSFLQVQANLSSKKGELAELPAAWSANNLVRRSKAWLQSTKDHWLTLQELILELVNESESPQSPQI